MAQSHYPGFERMIYMFPFLTTLFRRLISLQQDSVIIRFCFVLLLFYRFPFLSLLSILPFHHLFCHFPSSFNALRFPVFLFVTSWLCLSEQSRRQWSCMRPLRDRRQLWWTTLLFGPDIHGAQWRLLLRHTSLRASLQFRWPAAYLQWTFKEERLTEACTWEQSWKHWGCKDAIGLQSVGSYTDQLFVRYIE